MSRASIQISVLTVIIACASLGLHQTSMGDPVHPSFSPDDEIDHPLFWCVLFSDYCEGEFFSVANPSESMVSLSNWSVTDGEGCIILPKDLMLAPHGQVRVARDPLSFLEQNGYLPEYSINGGEGIPEILTQNGTFRLNNEGDELILMDPDGNVVDTVLFGNSDLEGFAGWTGERVPAPGRGRMIQRQSTSDTNSKEDWLSLREYRPGQSSFPCIRSKATVTPLLLPEHSNYILEHLGLARFEVHICSYEFDSELVLFRLLTLIDQGVKVNILLEGSPAGGLSAESRSILSALTQRGAVVDLMTKSDLSLRRFPCIHAKYVVIDGRTSIVMSENMVSEVFDSEPGSGNRGWAAVIESPDISAQLLEMFMEDRNPGYGDISGVEFEDTLSYWDCDLHQISAPVRSVPAPISRNCIVSLFTFPDCTEELPIITLLIRESTISIFCQVFYVDLFWDTWGYGEIMSPVIMSLVDTCESLDQFVLCMDGSWLSEADGRNEETIGYLSGRLRATDLFVGNPGINAPFDVLHNKGLVIDHRYSWVSSANWNCASFCGNREIGILIDDVDVAQFFESRILIDIYGETEPPQLLLNISLSEDGSEWILRMSDESDESGLSSVLFFREGMNRSEWELRIGVDEDACEVKIFASDLYDNRAEYNIMLFPDRTLLLNDSFAAWSSGLLLSCLSAALIALLLTPKKEIWRVIVRPLRRKCHRRRIDE